MMLKLNTGLDDICHHAVVRLSICRLVHIGDDFGSFTTQNSTVNLWSSHHCCGQKIADTRSLQLDDRLNPAPFPACLRDLWPSVLALNPLPQVFSPPALRASSRRCASKYLFERVLHCVAALQVQAAGDGHLRSRIAGKWFPDETPNGDFQ